MDKLMKTAKKLDVFFKVLQNVLKTTMIVVVCVLVVLTVANAINPHAIIAEGNYYVDLGSVTLRLTESYSPTDNQTILLYAWIIIGLSVIAVIAMYYAFGQIRKILQPMSEGSPFDPTISVNFRKMANVSIIMGVVVNLASFIKTLGSINMIEKLDLIGMLGEGHIKSITANFNVDLMFLVVFFVFLLMSYIFRYGEELQQQVDETL